MSLGEFGGRIWRPTIGVRLVGPSNSARRITKGTKVREHEREGISEGGMGEETWRSRDGGVGDPRRTAEW